MVHEGEVLPCQVVASEEAFPEGWNQPFQEEASEGVTPVHSH